jgi:transcriptional regulator with GAF, ATPase, and Fis domain
MKAGFEQHTAALLDALRDVLCNLAEPQSVLKAILQQAVEMTAADRGLLVEVSGEGRLDHKVLVGITSQLYDGPAGDFSRHLLKRVVENGDDVLLKSAADDPYFHSAKSMQAIGTAAVLCVPIRSGERITAIIYLERKQGGFVESHREVLRSLAAMAGLVLESVRASQEHQILDEGRRRAEAEQREKLKEDWAFGRFLGRSPAVRGLERTLRSAAAHDKPLLILGETGTGKSILARAVHFEGPRAKKEFVTVFCPSLEKGLVEGELFGHRRGSFTNAVNDRVGKVQLADGGTLFLDEVGELPLDIQAKLFRLLEEGTFEVVGDPREHRANVRVVAATNRDLEADVRSGKFRGELLGRLDMLQIRVPPLRERREDIGLLLRDCLDREQGGRWIELTDEAIHYLESLPYDWPRNVRDLKRIATLLTVAGLEGPVTPTALASLFDGRNGSPAGTSGTAVEDPAGGLPEAVRRFEREWLRDWLARHSHLTREQQAERLRISQATLFKRISDHGLGDA